jgi:hypothetical protein
MEKRFLEIKDKNGTWFRLKLVTPYSNFLLFKQAQQFKNALTAGGWFGGSLSGEWTAMDEGFIRIRSGKTKTRFSDNGDLTTMDLLILGPEGIKTYDSNDLFGMQLFEYRNFFLYNSSGEGVVVQPWVIGLTPGRISWKVIR